jgi:heat-inducible transcriptional repressor
MFVDQLSNVKPLSAPERRAIETFLEGALDLDDVVMRTVKLLADVTKQVAVVQYPSLVKSRVRHVELVLLNSIRTMLILITDTGRVEQRVIELATEVDDEFLNAMRIKLNNSIAGQRLPDVADKLSALMDSLNQSDRRNMAVLISTLIEMALEKPEEKVVLAGTANLTRFRQDFSAQIHPILEALEEQVVLLRLLGGASSGVQVRIGSEQSEVNLQETSVISMGYGEVGALGVIGPTRMDYASSMAAVSAVANYVSRYLQENA